MPTTDEPGALRAAITELTDRAEIGALLDRYVVTLDTHDEMGYDDDWYRTIFTEDAWLEFPIGAYEGVAGLADFETGAKGKWDQTHHLATNCLINVDGDEATVRAHVRATHIHHRPADSRPKPHFDVGGYYTMRAARTADGWRFSRLTFHLVWTSGPGLPTAGDSAPEETLSPRRSSGRVI